MDVLFQIYFWDQLHCLLQYEILEKLVTYTRLYETGIKKNKNKSMETTKIISLFMKGS